MKPKKVSKCIVVFTVITTCLGFSVNKSSANTAVKTVAQTIDNFLEPKIDIAIPVLFTDIPAVKFIGLTANNTLVNINLRGVSQVVQVTGINGNLQAIDFRPANRLLYGVTDTDNVYTIDPVSGVATFVSKLSSSFNGGFQSGFDFNPVPDRLRIVGSNKQNFRTNVDTGQTIADVNLAYGATDANAGVDPNITAEAYTNSFAGTTTTQLFGIDYDLDVLVLQNPPNNGTLQTIGSLGVNFSPIGGFDIFTDAQGKNTAYAVSDTVLYTINLSTGAATKIANVPRGNFIGLAVTSND
jgi:hypothetical protein